MIQKYRDSDEYQALATGTVKYYERFLRDIEALGPMLPFASFTRRALVDFIESYPKTFQRRQSAVVLKKFKLAGYHSVVPTDQTAGLRLKTSRPRDRIWTDEEIARRIEVDGAEDPQMTTAFLLLKFTAQARETVSGWLGRNTLARQFGYPNKRIGALLDIPDRPRRPRSGLPDAEIEVRRTTEQDAEQ